MKTQCIIGKIKNISSCSDKFLERRIKEEGLPILRNHIPLFYILPINGDKMLFNELAKCWNISKSSLSDIINKYEALGLIKRCCCTEDKRTVYLSLTEEALEVKNTLELFDKEFLDVVLKDFTAKERQIFEEVIEKALNNSCEF